MQTVRPAGNNEQRCIARDTLGLYGSIVALVTYDGPSYASKELLFSDIIQALKYCISKHPVLSTVIQDSNTESPQLARVSSLDLWKHIRVVDVRKTEGSTAGRIQRLLEQAHSEPLADYDVLPQWRVYLDLLHHTITSTRFHLGFASSHALADGISGCLFHTSFFEGMQNINTLNFDSNPLLEISSIAQIPLPLELAADLPISWSFLLRPALQEYLPVWLVSILGLKDTKGDNAWCGSSTRPSKPCSTNLLATAVRSAFVPHETLKTLLQACRCREVRLTGLLNHLTARALAQALQNRGHAYTRFIAETAIDLRKCIPNAEKCMANYSSAISEVLDVTSAFSNPADGLNAKDWAMIRSTTELLSKVSNTLADQPVALLRYVQSIRAWVVKQSTKAANASFGMSNVGMFREATNERSGDEQNWSIEAVVFSQSADGVGPPLNVNVASVEGGCLAIVVTWWPGMLGMHDEETFVEEVCQSIASQLEAIPRRTR